mgnify:CR=1 FL=1
MNAPTKLRALPPFAEMRTLLPGLMLCSVIAITAAFVADHYGGPKFLYALLIGIAFHFLSDNDKCIPGIELSAKKLVQLGVALLGVRIPISDVTDLGLAGLGALVGAVLLTIGFGLLMARLLGLSRMLGLLSGGAVGICGISAAMAISATLPQTKENEHCTLLTAIGIATFSTAAMILYPLLVSAIGLSVGEAGMFLGGSIHDVAQVVGAAFMISPAVGDAATLAKMFRVAMLVPVVMVLAVSFGAETAGAAGGGKKAPLLPLFLLAFAALVVINSFGLVPPAVVAISSDISSWCLVISIAALGVKTSFEKLAALGWKPVVLLLSETLFIALYMLCIVFLTRLFD